MNYTIFLTEPIGVSRSFRTPLRKYVDLEAALSSFVERACEKLRGDNLRATGLVVSIRTNPFVPTNYYSNSYTLTFSNSKSTPEMIRYALFGLKKIFKPDRDYKKAGVMLIGLTSQTQMSFLTPHHPKTEILMKSIDQLNRKYGSRTLLYASSLQSHALKSYRKMLSQRYTTCWHELRTVT